MKNCNFLSEEIVMYHIAKSMSNQGWDRPGRMDRWNRRRIYETVILPTMPAPWWGSQ